MSRLSSLVLGSVALGIVASASACQVSVKSKTRYLESNVAQAATSDWVPGTPIKINIQGVGTSINGGVTVRADASVTKVTATARMLAMALPEEKDQAELSLAEAKASFKVTSDSTGVNVVCGHGAKHGSSEAGESGCELVEIVIPAGDQANKLTLEILSGSGTQTLQLASAFIANVGSNCNGADTVATLPATPEGTISLVSESGDITATLPSNFAADEVILQADAASIALGPFSDIKNGAGAGGRGTAGTGLKSLKLTSKEFAGSTGVITLKQ